MRASGSGYGREPRAGGAPVRAAGPRRRACTAITSGKWPMSRSTHAACSWWSESAAWYARRATAARPSANSSLACWSVTSGAHPAWLARSARWCVS